MTHSFSPVTFAAVLAISTLSSFARQPATVPSEIDAMRRASTIPTTLPEGELKFVVVEIFGTVGYRTDEAEPFKPLTKGMELVAGTEIQTKRRSAALFSVGNNTNILFDRFGKGKLLRAEILGGKLLMDFASTAGRTQVETQAAQYESDVKVHTPNSVLAVRGTKVVLFDQPPFAPEAVSITGRASFRDIKRSTNLGGSKYASISGDSKSAADHARNETRVDPRGPYSGSTETEYILQTSLAVQGGSDFSNLGVLALLDDARDGKFKGTVIGAIPLGKQLSFDVIWFGDPGTDLDLSLISPRGEKVSFALPTSPSGALHSGDNAATTDRFGFENIIWQLQYPPGIYDVTVSRKPGQGIIGTAQLQVTEDKNSDNGRIIADFFTQTVGPNDIFRQKIDTRKTQPPAGGRTGK